MKKNILLILILSIALAYIESTAAIYLRSLYYPDGFPFPLQTFNNSHLLIELGREVSIIIILLGLGYIIGKNFLQRFAFFMFTFGVWDIFYYIWLKLLIDWPESLFAWDILFLIPFPWFGPVLSPVLVSLCLIISSMIVIHFETQDYPIIVKNIDWIILIFAGIIIIFSYLQHFHIIMNHGTPDHYSWWLFTSALSLGVITFLNRIRVHIITRK
jgi:hypothetical protein